ncbi:MAG: peptide MFS transporter [Acidobacteria bacterium]|nr:peptide MFS transporter [Acidobacteriota bacterium]
MGGHPKGLSTLFFTEMWERFSYYGTRAFLMLYMTAAVASGGLGFDTAKAATIYGAYTSSAYFATLPGGWIADNILGARRSVLIGGILISIGNLLLFLGTMPLFYAGLGTVVVGTGLLKSNAAAIVGELYGKNDPRRDAGFSIFYMGINFGAFISPIICGWVAQRVNFRLAFLFAVIGMAFGVVQFVMGRRRLDGAGELKPRNQVAASAETTALKPGESSDWAKLSAIGVLFCFSAIFWGAFEQAGSSLNLFARDLTANTVFGWEYPSSWLQALNAVFIVSFAPVFSWMWMRMGDKQPSSPAKFAYGLLLAGAGFLVVAYATSIAGGGKVSPLWLVLVYLLHTFGELSLGPVGLSAFSALAPPRVAALMMGVYYLSISAGNLLAGLAATTFDASNPESVVRLFGTVAGVCVVAGLVLFAITPFLKKLMGGVR